MTAAPPAPSARRDELLELAYQYAVARGRADLSLRPLASAIGSSPRVLLYLFGSKDGLVRALLARARADELALLGEAGGSGSVAEVAGRIWTWLAEEPRRDLMALWVDGYARSLADPGGPWAGFAAATVADWLAVFAAAQPPAHRDSPAGLAERSLVLAVLRGALMDLLATGDTARTTAAVRQHLATLPPAGAS